MVVKRAKNIKSGVVLAKKNFGFQNFGGGESRF